MIELNVGDVVIIKKNLKEEDGGNGFWPCHDMFSYRGDETYITKSYGQNLYTIGADEGQYVWHTNMFSRWQVRKRNQMK